MTVCSTWATEDDFCAPCAEIAYELDPEKITEFMLTASELLYEFSGQQFPGICDTTVRPCSRKEFRYIYSQPIYGGSALAREAGFFASCGCHSALECSCTYLSAIELPDGPALDVSEVTIEDVPLDSSAYELRGQQLVRLDDESWPCCGIEITYSYGVMPPRSGVTAAAVLACELYMACAPGDFPDGTAKCRLPKNISAISRQGVSVIFKSLTDRNLGEPFRFGILEIDLFLEAFNPDGNRAQSVFMSPDDFPMAERVQP